MASGEKEMAEGRLILGKEALDLLRASGLSVLRTEEALDEAQAVEAARAVGYPVALKLSQAVHKTELGGVRVGLRYAEEVRGTFRQLRRLQPTGPLLLQEMGQGLEAFVGVLTDPSFGPVLAFGLGGIFVEVLEDLSFRLIPIGREDAREMIEELRAYPALSGARGRRVDLEALEGLLLGVSDLVKARPQLLEMDLNPVFLSEDGYRICDARIIQAP